MRKRLLAVMTVILVVMFLVSGCGGTTSGSSAGKSNPGTVNTSHKDEVYVWACEYNSLPLFVNNDYIGLDIAAKELGVTVKKIGPQNIDLPGMISAIEQEIPLKPKGMIVVGWDNALSDPINKAMGAGIPVVVVDGDIPSKRLCYIGTDWYDVGTSMAQSLKPYLQDKTGDAVFIGCPGSNNDERAALGFEDTIKTYNTKIKIEPKIYDGQSDSLQAAKIMSNLIKSDPNLIAVLGTESSSGPGIAQAIKEAGKVGKIYESCVDIDPEQLQVVKDGTAISTIGQKRQLFTYYGIKILYDYNHDLIHYTSDDAALGMSHIPVNINTGVITVDKTNVDKFIKSVSTK